MHDRVCGRQPTGDLAWKETTRHVFGTRFVQGRLLLFCLVPQHNFATTRNNKNFTTAPLLETEGRGNGGWEGKLRKTQTEVETRRDGGGGG